MCIYIFQVVHIAVSDNDEVSRLTPAIQAAETATQPFSQAIQPAETATQPFSQAIQAAETATQPFSQAINSACRSPSDPVEHI